MFALNNKAKYIKYFLIAVCLLYFAFGTITAVKYGPDCYLGNFKDFNNDDVKYVRSAWTLVDKHIFVYNDTSKPTVFIMPGISYVLAFFMILFGKMQGIIAFRIFQSLIQTLSLFLTFLIAKKVLNNAIGIIACMLSLFYISEYYSSCLILTEVPFKFLLLSLVYISIHAVEKKKTAYYVFGGIIWGAACLFRPTIAMYPAVILIIWLARRYSFKEMLRFSIAAMMAFSLVLSPWVIRNMVVFKEFIPLTLSAGDPFLLGTYINYDVPKYRIETPNPGITDINYEIGLNNYKMEIGKYRLRVLFPESKLAYVYWYTIGKTIYFWFKPFYWDYIWGVKHPVMFTGYHRIILAAALIGVLICFVRKNSNILTIIITIVYFNLVHLPFVTNERYAYPVMPFVIILSSCFIYELAARIKRSQLIKIISCKQTADNNNRR